MNIGSKSSDRASFIYKKKKQTFKPQLFEFEEHVNIYSQKPVSYITRSPSKSYERAVEFSQKLSYKTADEIQSSYFFKYK